MSVVKRRKHYIDREVQRALLRQVLSQWTLFLTAAFLLLFFWQVLAGGPYLSFSHHLSVTWSRYAPLIVILLAFIPVSAFDSIKLSNRFVGPIYRFRGAMRRLATGERVAPLHFRKRDFWQDLAESFNTVLAQLQPHMSRPDGEEGSEAQETQSMAEPNVRADSQAGEESTSVGVLAEATPAHDQEARV